MTSFETHGNIEKPCFYGSFHQLDSRKFPQNTDFRALGACPIEVSGASLNGLFNRTTRIKQETVQ